MCGSWPAPRRSAPLITPDCSPWSPARATTSAACAACPSSGARSGRPTGAPRVRVGAERRHRDTAGAQVKVAVIGSGIAGSLVALRLCRECEVTVYEADDHIGGHVHTHAVTVAGTTHQVDTGFIVYNDKTYPRFSALLRELRVATQP